MQAPVLDQDVLASLRELQGEGETDLVGELVELFIEDTPARIAELCQAVARGALEATALAAHSCKGSSANVGANALAAACGALEAAARTGTTASLAPLFVVVEDALGQTIRALREEWPEVVG